jgi:hypothetical protein
MNIKKEIIDQTLHVLWCWLVICPLFLIGGMWGFALTGFMICLVREISQRGVPVTMAKIKDVFLTEKLDMIFWTLGGILFWLLFI